MRSLMLASMLLFLACGARTPSSAPPAPLTPDAPLAAEPADSPAEPTPTDPTPPGPDGTCAAGQVYAIHGCGGPEFATGCYTTCGPGMAACPSGTTCTQTMRNPCAPAPGSDPRHATCAACGAEIHLCL